MPKIKFHKAYAKLTADGFDGIRDSAIGTGKGAVSVRNFRFRSDKTLEKRPGFTLMGTFASPVRAYWKGQVGGGFFEVVLAGNTVFRLASDASPTAIGTVLSESGNAGFFSYRNYLYLTDGQEFYVADSAMTAFRKAVGYVPLYGVNWDAGGAGEVNEDVNLFSKQICIHYINNTASARIKLPFAAASIDRLLSNGNVVSYTFTPGNDYFTLANPNYNSRIQVVMTLQTPPSDFANLRSCALPYSFIEDGKEELFLSGGTRGYALYASSEVTDEMLSERKQFWPNTDPLYVKSGGVMALGDSTHPIKAFLKQSDRIIALGMSGAWSVRKSEIRDGYDTYFLNSCPNCVLPGGVIPVEKGFLTFSDRGLLRVTSNAGNEDLFFATTLFREISEQFRPADFSNPIFLYDPTHTQLFVRDAAETGEGLVWVLDLNLKLAYCWDGIYANFFFRDGRSVVFGTATDLCKQSSGITTDNGSAITAYYQSGALSFSHPEEVKRILRAYLSCCAYGESVTLKVKTETQQRTKTGTCQSDLFPENLDYRLALGRFRYTSYRITVSGTGSANLYQVMLCCRL